MAGNKVRFNLKNVHYAKLTVGEDGAETFAAPVHIPGAVSLTLAAEGDTTPFYADGIQYFVAVANNGYSGSLELALIPDSFRKEILGDIEDETDKVLVENAFTEGSPYALLFEFDGDVKSIRHVLYNCKSSRPNMDGSTTTGTKEPATETISVTASALSDGLVKARTQDSTVDAAYLGWYKQVWRPKQTGEAAMR